MKWTLPRDTVVWLTALALLVYEVVEGGGRPFVLTGLLALLGTPYTMRLDRLLRQQKDGGQETTQQ